MSRLTPFILLFFSSQYPAIADIKFTGKNNVETTSSAKKERGATLPENNTSNSVKLETANSKISPSKKEQLEPEEKIKPQQIETEERELYEIEGYINSDKVRIVIEMDKNQEVVGNMYNSKGMQTYMHGEYINGAFEMYDAKGEHYRVLMAE